MTTLAGALIGVLIVLGLLMIAIGATPTDVKPSGAAAAGPRPRPTWTRLTRLEKILGSTALVFAIVMAATQGWFILLVLAPLVAIGLPRLLSPPPRETPEHLEAIEEWVRALHGLLVANPQLKTAIVATLPSAPALIRDDVERLVSRIQARRPLDAALYQFAADLDSPIGDFVVSALVMSANVSGAGLTRSLDAIAIEVADEVRARRDISIEHAKAFATCRAVSVIMILIAIGVIFFTPYGRVYTTPIGQLALALITSLFAGCLAWMRAASVVASPERFLVTPRETLS
ncbi:type II secretion system F family protein [Arsenicicoccus sp. UBA7492]|uniref:type II secretion system F family protein n=1 Tax=Arsenicicoccus sp. UBA7492 TaxID=1946057 RepID=UPI0025800024|nr:hypothetical protein [Arsenicicoccus sp. UBA7492]